MPRTQIGKRIRAVRQAQGYTLKQLAGLAGVSPSFLSMLENGKTDVTAGRLHAIAAAFGLRSSDLMPDASSNALIQTVRSGERPALGGFATGVHAHMLARDLHRRIQPVLLTLEAGCVHSNLVGHAGEEFVFMFRGRILLVVDMDHEATLEPGDAAYYPSALSHSYRNIGDGIAELMTMSTPPKIV